MKRHLSRSQKGQITEFAAAFVAFILVALPLIDVCSIPARYMLCQGIISELTSSLAHCEKRTDAYLFLKKDQSWKDTLSKFGVVVSNEQLTLLATTTDGSQKIELSESQKPSADWLPDGAKGPFIYSLTLKANCAIAAGLNTPVNLTVSGNSQWENVSPDPKTLKYFIAE